MRPSWNVQFSLKHPDASSHKSDSGKAGCFKALHLGEVCYTAVNSLYSWTTWALKEDERRSFQFSSQPRDVGMFSNLAVGFVCKHFIPVRSITNILKLKIHCKKIHSRSVVARGSGWEESRMSMWNTEYLGAVILFSMIGNNIQGMADPQHASVKTRRTAQHKERTLM